MMMHYTSRILGALVLCGLLAAPAMADPPANKGKGNDASAEHGKSGEHGQSGTAGTSSGRTNDSYDDRNGADSAHHDDGKDSNHGQVVSECNHRANDRHMQGQDRKQWVEWCEEHGARFNYENRSWNLDRSCYQKADDRNLSGDRRRSFLHDCLAKTDHTRYDDSKYNTTGEPRGRDVLGKGQK